jgi:hypothetical protein
MYLHSQPSGGPHGPEWPEDPHNPIAGMAQRSADAVNAGVQRSAAAVTTGVRAVTSMFNRNASERPADPEIAPGNATDPDDIPILDIATARVEDSAAARKEFMHHRRTLRAIYVDITKREFSDRQRFFHIIHGTPAISPDDIISMAYNVFIVLIVAASTITFIFETLPVYYDPGGPQGTFFALESIWVVVFTVDLMLRWMAATKLQYAVNILVLCDLMSVSGYYIAIFLDEDQNEKYQLWLQLLRMLRLTRVFRIGKLMRYGVGFSLMTRTIRRSREGMWLLGSLVLISMVVCATVFYSVETAFGSWDPVGRQWLRPNGAVSPFQSIIHCFYFIGTTLTTTGYGDQVPSQGYGRAVAVCVMFLGTIFLAFPNFIIGANFQSVHEKWERQVARDALGKRFRYVRYVVRFVRMWRDFRRSGHMRLLQASSVYKPDELARRRGDIFTGEGIGGPRTFIRRTNNFMFSPVNFREYNFSATFQLLSQGHIDKFKTRGLPAVEFLRRLVQMFSCCCTIEELYESLLFHPVDDNHATQRDLAELACHLANASLIDLYVLNRAEDRMLMSITRKGIDEVRHYKENLELPCLRCVAEAHEIWHATTSTPAPTLLPVDGFRHWQEIQETVPKRIFLTFTYDLKKPAANNNNIFRGVRAPTGPRYAFRSRNESHGEANSGDTGCKACQHCVAAMLSSSTPAAQLDAVEAFFQLQRQLAEENLRLVAVIRAAAATVPAASPHPTEPATDGVDGSQAVATTAP